MRKISIVLIIVTVLFGIDLSKNQVVADSGWNGGYSSSGGSYHDYGGSSSSSSRSGRGSRGSSSSTSNAYFDTAEYLFEISFCITCIIVWLYNLFKPKTKVRNDQTDDDIDLIIDKSTATRNLEDYKIENIESKIKKVIPDFKKKNLEKDTFDLYKKIQIAWMDFDYKKLRECCADDLYHMYKSQLETLKKQKRKNIMKNFSKKDFNIVDFSSSSKEIEIKVRMVVQCYDYVIDANNKVVKGTDQEMNIYDYEMIFIRSIENKHINKCPNCSAKIKDSNSTICEFCHSSLVNNDNYNLVLAKKRVVGQYR